MAPLISKKNCQTVPSTTQKLLSIEIFPQLYLVNATILIHPFFQNNSKFNLTAKLDFQQTF